MNYVRKQAIRGLIVIVILVVAATLGETAIVQAADYPTRDITFVVPYGPGGGSDAISRKFAIMLEKVLRSNVNVESKPGGSGTIGVGAVVRAKPDGYTIGLGTNSSLIHQALIHKGLSYKTPDDYQTIVKLADLHYNLAVKADAPWKTFEEFVADVRKNPGKIRVSTAGKGTAPDLVVQRFNQVAGVKLVSVPFTGGGGEGVIALLGGRVEATAGTSVSVAGHVQAGKLRVLALFQKGKHDLFPDATPVAEAGYDATLPVAYYVIAPKGIPKDVQDKLIAASLQVVQNQEFTKFAVTTGFVPDGKGPAAAKEELVQYIKTFSELIKFIDQK